MHEYIYNSKSILEQFEIFYNENKPKDMQTALEFFSVFGGLNRKVDCNDDIKNQIKIHILNRYKFIRNDVSQISKGDELTHKILSSLALGDRRTNSAFKRAKISFDNGIDIIDEQCKLGMLKLEKSMQKITNNDFDDSISEKLVFTTPFCYFWFAFVSPIFKGVRDGDFDESINHFENNKDKLITFTYELLSREVIKKIYKDDEIKTIGSYWDNSTSIIDIIAKTKSNKTIVCNLSYTNSKTKKTKLNDLKNTCKKLNIKADDYILFSKKGFTVELKSLKDENNKLFYLKNLNLLINKNQSL